MRTYCIIVLAISMNGCGNGNNDYFKTISSAKTGVPYALQMEDMFSQHEHFIVHYGDNANPMVWKTIVWFGNRYRLSMSIKVNVDYSANSVKSVGDPDFVLHEISKVIVKSDGGVEAHYGGVSNQIEFGLAEWNTLLENDGDFSSIGVSITDVPIPDFQKHADAIRRDIPHVSLRQVE